MVNLLKFYAWLVSNKLPLNVDKTNFMVFSIGKMYNNFNISMNNVPLQRVKRAKFLGVYIDDKFTWGIILAMHQLKSRKA